MRILTMIAGLVLAGSAHAADLVVDVVPTAPPADEVPVIDFGGFYVGGMAGLHMQDWGAAEADILGQTYSLGGVSHSGFAGGAFAGYNHLLNENLVVGAEASILFLDGGVSDTERGTIGGSGTHEEYWTIGGNPILVDTFDYEWSAQGEANVNADIDYIAAFTPRIGWLVRPDTMLYAKGGVAYGRFNVQADGSYRGSGSASGNAIPALTYVHQESGSFTGSDSQNEWGWTIGAGVEHQVWKNVFVGFDYAYTRFDLDGTINGRYNTSATGNLVGAAGLVSEVYSDSSSGRFEQDYETTIDNHSFMARIGLRF